MLELSLPSGSLENAINAFSAGADSVYFGLKEFSARKGAANFTISDFRKIRKAAKEKNKKIYITINTLIKDSELKSVFTTLKEIERYGVDGIIVQDLGVIRMMRRYFPSLRIHASTQLAVHTDYGVKMLKLLGAERVVLSRELSLSEIEKIRKDNPDIELKVFIHGAMCYGFSGLCMASLEKTGRSANRGECAQICRTWFTCDGKKIFPFSMKDMDAGEEILLLDKMGIDSVKVEGRMKGNEFVYYTARYYRNILDGTKEKDLHSYTFLREHSSGFFNYSGPGHNRLITENYTQHEGKDIGTVISQSGRKLKLSLNEEIKDRDGLMILLGKNESYKFAAKVIRENEIQLDGDIQIPYGSHVYKISDSSIALKKINTDALKEEKESIEASIKIMDGRLRVETPILKKEYEVKTEKALKEANTESIRRIFSQSTGDKALNIISIDNPENLYVREKEAKEKRRDFLSLLDKAERKEKEYTAENYEEEGILLPERKLLEGKYTPWNEDGVTIDGTTYITLSPVTYNEEEKYEHLIKKAEEIEEDLMIGLNNIADVFFAKNHPQYSYFMDVYLYASNRESTALIKDILKESLKGAYLAVDFNSYESPWPIKPTPLNGYKLPLFISRSCFRHDSLALECKGCTHHHTFHIEQNGKKYTVIVDNCQSLVKEEPSED